MKSKTEQQIESAEVRSLHNQQAAEELLMFQLAVASYADSTSTEPGISFYAHLCNFLAQHPEYDCERLSP